MKLSKHIIDMRLGRQQTVQECERGYAMAALLIALSVMSIMMSMALPVWSHAAKREREAELVFRGEQYMRAIELYQRKYAGAFPPDFDTLIEQRFLRRLYKDPMTETGEFQPVFQAQANAAQGGPATAARPGETTGSVAVPGGDDSSGRGQAQGGGGLTAAFGEIPQQRGTQGGAMQGGLVGVVSKSTDSSIMLYNGRGTYSEWAFIFMPSAAQPGGDQQGVQPGVRPARQLGGQQPGGTPQPPNIRAPGGVERPAGSPFTPGR